jgi:hypothetical protein
VASFLDPHLLSRRVLAGLAGAALAVAGLGASEVLGKRLGTRKIYVLNPEWGAGRKGCPKSEEKTHKKGGGCHACVACHRHGRNKRFATRQAADKGRAHKHCRCRIETKSVSAEEFERMFGKPGSANFQKEFDKRR